MQVDHRGHDSTGLDSIPNEAILGIPARLKFDLFQFGAVRLQPSCGSIRFDAIRDRRVFRFDSVLDHRSGRLDSVPCHRSVRFGSVLGDRTIRFGS